MKHVSRSAAATLLLLGAANAIQPLADIFEAVKFESKSSVLTNTDAVISNQDLVEPFPYDFPDQDLANSTELFAMPKCHGLTLEEATIDQLQGYMSSGKLTCSQLAMCYLQRYFQTNEYIASVLEINPDFLQIAAALDAERKAGKVRGPLHGIPFMVKDNIATKDRMQTTAGSWALQGSIVPRDAHVVKKLREAGALLFGKASLSEWADMRSNDYSEGYSARGGQCRSPYNLTLSPGGSSSGSAAGVAANVFSIALGTETDGSVIDPAMRNGIVGFKPTVGLTSRNGVIPESANQDSVGTFGKTVRDAVYALDAIYGVDTRDNYTSAQVGKTPKRGYMPYMSNKSALKGAKFGLPWDTFWRFADAEQISILTDLLELIEGAGATIINGTEMPNHNTTVAQNGWDWDWGTTRGYPNESEYTVVKADFYNNIATYLSELENTDVRSLEDIVAYNYANDGTEGGHEDVHPAFASGQDGFLASLAWKGEMNETYWQALNYIHHNTREGGLDAALNHNDSKLDGLLVPSDVHQTYQIAAQAGYPMVTLPAGVHSSTKRPFGLAIMQTAFAEAQLVKYASAIEDLQLSSGTPYKRSLPKWFGYLQRNIPV